VGTAGRGEARSAGAAPIRVFVVDDHAIIRDAVRLVLEMEPGLDIVGEAASAAEAVRSIPAAEPDVAIIDAKLGDEDGIVLVQRIRSMRPRLRCVVFTSFPGRETLFRAVSAGATGYVSKEFGGVKLVEAIKRVASGRSVLCWDDRGMAKMSRPPGGAAVRDPLDDLTGQEQRILGLLSEGRTNREIADDLRLAEKTVRNYVSNILAKLGLRNRTEAATYVLTHQGVATVPAASYGMHRFSA
jgi:two-component system response regulator DevR